MTNLNITEDGSWIIDTSKPVLYDYASGDQIRNATPEELAESLEAGDEGIITVDGRDCFVRE